MYRIYHLSLNTDSSWKQSDTDYDPMELGQAESIVTELNRDAIQSSLLERWIIIED
jgi:hypothetical protein